jgi:protocatechuate 3,4-dioxygenase beta subunit
MGSADIARVDARDGREGVELQLHFRVLDSSAACDTPVPDVEVYYWHTDAVGLYSGFDGQNPDMSYSGAFERTVENADIFCRGMGVTNADGIVSFQTLYPGWYNGRPVHIHFLALKPGSSKDTTGTMSYRDKAYHVFTTQIYFEEAFSRAIHEGNDPYKARATGTNYATYVKPASNVRPTTKMVGNVAVAALNILTDPKTSRK